MFSIVIGQKITGLGIDLRFSHFSALLSLYIERWFIIEVWRRICFIKVVATGNTVAIAAIVYWHLHQLMCIKRWTTSLCQVLRDLFEKNLNHVWALSRSIVILSYSILEVLRKEGSKESRANKSKMNVYNINIILIIDILYSME